MEQNISIITFMGGILEREGVYRISLECKRGQFRLEQLNFHSDWNLMMEVIKKIHNISINLPLKSYGTVIFDEITKKLKYCNLEVIYPLVIDFIENYKIYTKNN